jgi:hypothetical protein
MAENAVRKTLVAQATLSTGIGTSFKNYPELQKIQK